MSVQPIEPKKWPHRTAEQRAAAAQRRIQRKVNLASALELKLAGYSWEEIADQIDGYKTADSAYRAVKRHLDRRIQEPSAELVTLELSRLDAMQIGAWPQAINGDYAAIDRVLKIMQRRAQLLGLDRPIRYDLVAIVNEVAAELELDDDDTAALLNDVERHMAQAIKS